ncbi:MAG: hypothetical protein ABF723_11770 [Lentilactobacillus hilgardii]|uniref:hypothetical protein n=1 Tax=Lentilactobacillus hilgardii TaxID=1588 RepID=UPI001CC1D9D7|nr:hypothetical protein [Lentilactobacillus hilgardii]MBZ2200502.1 hypothetical protein [Lentilactobacillus hilgardii]MBZ2204622.1 hypothetical protein [Lentilactobacillus hilgardii]
MSEIHGMALNGQPIELPNTSLDSDWKQVETNRASMQTEVFKCYYRVLNGVLYVEGQVALNEGTNVNYGLVKMNSLWKLPDFSNAEPEIAFQYADNTIDYVHWGYPSSEGYFVQIAHNTSIGYLPIALSIPVI